MRVMSVMHNQICTRNVYVLNPNISFIGKYLPFKDVEECIKNGDIETIKTIEDLEISDKKQNTLLHLSSKYNQPEISKFLLFKRLNPNIKNFYGKTPFAIACSRMNKKLVENFLLYDIDINTQDNFHNTPLHQATSSPEIIKLLMNKNANPYLVNDFGRTPFTNAFSNKDSLVVYLEHGVNPNTEILHSQTLMHEAIIKNKLDIAKLLKKYNAEVNYKDDYGKSPIFYANNSEVLDWLVENGAKINLKDDKSQTVLHKNVINNNLKLVPVILKHNANLEVKDNNGRTPITYAKTVRMLELLLKNGANPDVILPNLSTILHNCSKTNNLEAVYYLVHYKANPNIKDKYNNVPLDLTTNNDIRTLLLAAGSNPNYKNYLITALKSKNSEFFNNLLECGANPNLTDEIGNSSLFYINNEEELMELKKHDALLNITNKKGYTPILHFALLGEKEKVDLFKKYGAIYSEESIQDCYQKFNDYHSWIKPKPSISFSGRPYTEYGTPQIRKNLDYKTQLTEDKINCIIQQAPITNEGINEVYKQLFVEEQKIYTAMRGFNVILKHFNVMTSMDVRKLASDNPAGSKIPVLGIIKQLEDTVLTDNFINQIRYKANEIKKDYEKLIEVYYTNEILPLTENYLCLNNYIKEGIEYINYVEGEDKQRNLILEKLEEKKSKLLNIKAREVKQINTLSGKYENIINKLVNIQKDKQNKRTAAKITIKILLLGM